jgi:hypothetical protein
MSDVSPQWAHRWRITYTAIARLMAIPTIGNAMEGKALGVVASLAAIGMCVGAINYWLRQEGGLR